jgi:serine/threonine protein kinase
MSQESISSPSVGSPLATSLRSSQGSRASSLRVRTASTSALLVQFKNLWDQGQQPTAQDFLQEHPEGMADKNLVVDLAYEEYCRRLDAGQKPDVGAFVAHFPHCQTSLGNLLTAHQFLAENAHLIAEESWPQPGDHYLGFELVRELGQGSFARVYLAREQSLGNRLVAIKVSYAGAAEGNILGQLSHPNVVPIYSIKQQPGSRLSAVCMPFLGEATLCDVLDHAFAGPERPRRANVILEALAKKHPAELAREKSPTLLQEGRYVDGVVSLGLQLAQALAFVHQQKIFHRDLKPSNVLLTSDGRPMLLDFNLSVQQDATTQPLGGTIPYMSPEQLRATDAEYTGPPTNLDERSDLFSLGVILYQLLTGKHPFGSIAWGQTTEELRHYLLQRQPSGPRPLRELQPEMDLKVARVIERCLAYDPRDRYASAAELAHDLEKCLPLPPGALRKLTGNRWVRRGSMAAALLLMASLVYSVFQEPAHIQHYREAAQSFRQGHYALAIDYCNRALDTNPQSSQIMFLRGKALHKIGEYRAALENYNEAEKLASPDLLGPLHANMAYCLNQLGTHEVAAKYYEKALAFNYANAALFNNLAYSYLKDRGNRSKAWTLGYLEKAQALDPNLQGPYHNQANALLVKYWEELQAAKKNGSSDQVQLSPTALVAIKKALDLGPSSGELFHQAAQIHVLASRGDKGLHDSALNYAQKAVEQGIGFKDLKMDVWLRPIHQHAQFEKLAQLSSTAQANPKAISVLDPAPDYVP